MTETSTRICPWCSTPIPAEAAACPKCGAAVEGVTAREIPGVTVPDPGASLFADEGLIPAAPITEEAILPPSEAVRLEMRKMQLEAEIANAGGAVLNPTGDQAILVGGPSQEAIEALKAGLLEQTAPDAETDLKEPSAQ
ncbi:MAG TPA: zinc-ribbon domain-containing protein [Candidatus Limnocylindrales bacterium]